MTETSDLEAYLCQALQATFAHELPITRPMGILVESYDGAILTLKAPLAANINHKDTAFAGSLNAVATLAGWGLLWLVLNEAGEEAKVVIQESSIQYLRPVTTDFSASCHKPSTDRLARFLDILRARGKARIELTVSIEHAGKTAVLFKGRFVAHRIGAFS